MPELQSKAFYLTPEEVNVLLIQCGVTGIQLFEAVTKCHVDEASAAQAIVSLAEKGVLKESKKGFSLNHYWRNLMNCIRDAEYTVVFTSPEGRIPVSLAFYQHENVVEMQVDARGGKRIKVGVFPAELFLEELLQTDAVPELDSWLPDERSSDAYIPVEMLYEDEKTTMIIERFQKGATEAENTIGIRKENVSDWMLLYKGEEQVDICPYNRDAFCEAVRNILNGQGIMLKQQETR